MQLLVLLLLGILSTCHGIYKIPEHDPCVLRVLLCDDFTKPLTPIDNSTLEMFKTIGELNAVCEELSKFRTCLKSAEIFCNDHSKLDTGFQLLKNRKLAFDLCNRGSSHQHVYMMVEECVNKYSHSAIEFCTDKAVETVGLSFYLGDIESECRFLGTIQHCHVAIVTDICGSIAGNMLEKLVVYRGERDFMCIGYERDRLLNAEATHATLDSYVEQYKKKVQILEANKETKRISSLNKDLKAQQEDSVQDRSTSEFHSRISRLTDEDNDFSHISSTNYKRPFNSGILRRSGKRTSISSCHQEINYVYMQPKPDHFFEKRARKYIPSQNHPCQMRALILLMGLRRNGERYPIGCGVADVLWDTFSPLKDIFCAWSVGKIPVFRCSVLIDPFMRAQEFCARKSSKKPGFNVTLIVSEPTSYKKQKKVAEVRLHSIGNNPSSIKKSLKIFEDHFYDIRYLCSVIHGDSLYKKFHSTNRVGFVPSETYNKDIVNREDKYSDEKYNFYDHESAMYPIDTEIHLMSPEEENVENAFEIEDTYLSQNHEYLKPLLSEIKLDEPSTLHPFNPPKLSHHSYRPYKFFRPHLGKLLEAEQDVKDAGRDFSKPKVLSGATTEDGSETQLNTEKIYSSLQENISGQARKRLTQSMKSSIRMAGPLDMSESENDGNRLIFNNPTIGKRKGKSKEPKNINKDNTQSQHEEKYVVSSSTKIIQSDHPTVHTNEEKPLFLREAKNLDEDTQICNLEDNGDLVEESEKSYSKKMVPERDSFAKSTNTIGSKEYLQFISNDQNDYPTSYKYIDASTNHNPHYEDEEFSTKPKMLNEESVDMYRYGIEEMMRQTLEVVAEANWRLRRRDRIKRGTPPREKRKTANTKNRLLKS